MLIPFYVHISSIYSVPELSSHGKDGSSSQQISLHPPLSLCEDSQESLALTFFERTAQSQESTFVQNVATRPLS